MDKFICPVDGCTKKLSRLQLMHFRSTHDCDPVEWVEAQYGSQIRQKYQDGVGSDTVASEYEWLSDDMVCEVVDTRSREEALKGSNNPMKRAGVIEAFTGESNPAKRPEVREDLSEAQTGQTLSDEAKEKISRKNSGREISAETRKKISRAASQRDTSYMQTQAYREALSESLKGREPTYPEPYEVASLSHPVRSSWEEDVATLLQENDVRYTYEKEFELSIGSDYLDFLLDSHAIDVKGFATDRSITKATAFMREFPSYTYVVVGDEIPCDIHLPWERRSELLEVISDV